MSYLTGATARHGLDTAIFPPHALQASNLRPPD